jgi:hypothetical protein
MLQPQAPDIGMIARERPRADSGARRFLRYANGALFCVPESRLSRRQSRRYGAARCGSGQRVVVAPGSASEALEEGIERVADFSASVA